MVRKTKLKQTRKLNVNPGQILEERLQPLSTAGVLSPPIELKVWLLEVQPLDFEVRPNRTPEVLVKRAAIPTLL